MKFLAESKKYLLALLFLILQISLFNVINLHGAVPHILLIFCLGYAFLTEKEYWGLFVWSGFLLDIFYYPGFGIGVLSFLVIAFLLKYVVNKLLFQKNLLLFLGVVIIISFVYHFVIWGMSYGLQFFIPAIYIIRWKPFGFVIAQLFYNLLVALPLFWLFTKKQHWYT